MFDWNDLKYLLAVAEHGSTLAAGRARRVSQTTVARRIAALEEALQLTLFEKRQAGYVLTPAGEELLGLAEEVRRAAERFHEAAESRKRDVSGTVRITTDEIYAHVLISPWLRDLRELHPDIVIEMDTSPKVLDLGSGAADIALRIKGEDHVPGLVGRQICVNDWTLYCSRDYADRNGTPTSVQDLKHHPIVGGGGGMLWQQYQAWLRALGLEDQIAMHHATSTGLLTAVRAGIGIAVLPCIIADAEPDLIRCLPPRDGHGRVLWLLTHERVRHTPRVRAVIDFLYECLKRHMETLAANGAQDGPASHAA